MNPLFSLILRFTFFIVVLQRIPAETINDSTDWSEYTIATELAQPVVLQPKTAPSITGYITEMTDQQITLETRADDGFVAYTIAQEEIRHLQFPGEKLKFYTEELIESGSVEKGLLLIDHLYSQRAPAFIYLPESDPVFFAQTIPLYRLHHRQADALARAEELKGWIHQPEMARLIDSEILLGHYNLGSNEIARSLAIQWIVEEPRQCDSALGWYVLSGLQLLDQSWDQAFFTALHPIVFSGPPPIPFLDHCYAHAISAAVQLGRFDQAQQLEAEMTQRNLQWPDQFPKINFKSTTAIQDNQPLE